MRTRSPAVRETGAADLLTGHLGHRRPPGRLRGLEPHVKRGEVKEICVVEEMRKDVRTDVKNRAFGFQFPVISCGATYAAKKVWGYAPVAPDGSACFQVPAGGRSISWRSTPRAARCSGCGLSRTSCPAKSQGCIGCHEQRASRDRRASEASARGRAGSPLRRALRITPEWGGAAAGFDYARIVQPVLDAHCVAVPQRRRRRPAKVDLCGDKTDFFNVSLRVLARGRKRAGEAEWDSPYVNWIPTYNGMEQNILEVTPKAWGSPRSKLADLLLAGHPDDERQAARRVDDAEHRRVLRLDRPERALLRHERNRPIRTRSGCRQHPARRPGRRRWPTWRSAAAPSATRTARSRASSGRASPIRR